MDRLIYTALTGMNAAMNRQRAVANNLANASTPGFRAEEFAVTPVTVKGAGIEARALARGEVRGADLSPGSVRQTGRPLDIAISGDALLALQGADGAEVYSRRGDLTVTASGVLQNGDGLAVMGEAGPITVPLGVPISIGSDGSIFAGDPQDGQASGELIDRIRLVSPRGARIAKDLDGLLRVPGGGVLPQDRAASVTSGALEGANINVTATLVDMIEAQRGFEQRSRILGTAGELDQSGAQLMSLSR